MNTYYDELEEQIEEYCENCYLQCNCSKLKKLEEVLEEILYDDPNASPAKLEEYYDVEFDEPEFCDDYSEAFISDEEIEAEYKKDLEERQREYEKLVLEQQGAREW